MYKQNLLVVNQDRGPKYLRNGINGKPDLTRFIDVAHFCVQLIHLNKRKVQVASDHGALDCAYPCALASRQ